ncbi:hypothetical protein [Flavisericum labens]|uniref:hypothetical protein n=1 Tax=Flavisericum labens TaxID=3377112 RepID=UPI00387B87D2
MSSIILVLLMSILMYFVLIVETSPFEYTMLIPVFLMLTGVLSVVFHFKTLEIYNVKKYTVTEFKNVLLWAVNAVFAIGLITTALYLIYTLLEADFREEYSIFISLLSIFALMILLGSGLLLEERFLYNIVFKNKRDAFAERIDNIKGNRKDP